MSVVPEDLLDLLAWDTNAFGHVATIGPKGEPQNNPVWFDTQDDLILFSQTKTR